MRLVWILPELASGPALAQQIPALIELDLDFLQTFLFIVRKRAPLEKLVFFINEVLNVIHHVLILVCHACLLFHEQLIRVAPSPMLARLKRLDDRMLSCKKVFGGMLVLRAIAAAHMTAAETETQLDPCVSSFQAVLATLRARRDVVNLI
jgi:hypothetical protein